MWLSCITVVLHEHHGVSNHWQHDYVFNNWAKSNTKTHNHWPFVRGMLQRPADSFSPVDSHHKSPVMRHHEWLNYSSHGTALQSGSTSSCLANIDWLWWRGLSCGGWRSYHNLCWGKLFSYRRWSCSVGCGPGAGCGYLLCGCFE